MVSTNSIRMHKRSNSYLTNNNEKDSSPDMSSKNSIIKIR